MLLKNWAYALALVFIAGALTQSAWPVAFSLAAVVVFPEPCRPARRIVVGGRGELVLRRPMPSMAVGFWNFVGAGVFGFLINLPIVSYYEVGTMLTPNHGHAAFMGVFGMLAVALVVFALREVLPDERWTKIERYIKGNCSGIKACGTLPLSKSCISARIRLWNHPASRPKMKFELLLARVKKQLSPCL